MGFCFASDTLKAVVSRIAIDRWNQHILLRFFLWRGNKLPKKVSWDTQIVIQSRSRTDSNGSSINQSILLLLMKLRRLCCGGTSTQTRWAAHTPLRGSQHIYKYSFLLPRVWWMMALMAPLLFTNYTQPYPWSAIWRLASSPLLVVFGGYCRAWENVTL